MKNRKLFAVLAGISALGLVGMQANASQEIALGWFSFNNSRNTDQGDGLWVGPGFYHTTVPNPNFYDGVWTGPIDNKLTPVYRNPDVDSTFGFDGPLQPITFEGDPNGLFIDMSNIIGSNDGNFQAGNTWGSFAGSTILTDGNPRTAETIFTGGSLFISGEANNGRHIDIVVDNLDYDISRVEWVQRGTSTGFTSRALSYSTDGGLTFVPFAADLGTLPGGSLPADEWPEVGFDVPVAGATIIRVTFDGASSASGNNRLDNLVVLGTQGRILGDANLDGVVDDTDLAILQANLSQPFSGWRQGDFTADGVVSLYDAYLLFTNYAPTSATTVSVIPEPASLALLGLGGLALLSRRRNG